jgi:methyltransferase (TIGR00027 family)
MLQVGLLCAIIRHRYIENVVLSMLKKGKLQVVLLGAGYDTKSLRLKRDNVNFFELDHPLTQKRKISILKKRNLLPSGTSFIPCDLTNDSPRECLLERGFDKNIPVIVIAEGVFSYFQKSRIGELMEDIGRFADDVSLVFDYRHPLDAELNLAKNWYKYFKSKGEQYLGLLTEVEMNKILDSNGFVTDFANDLYDIAHEFLPAFCAKDLKGSSELRIVSKKSKIGSRYE